MLKWFWHNDDDKNDDDAKSKDVEVAETDTGEGSKVSKPNKCKTNWIR